MNRYLNKFVNVTPSHSIELFDKPIAPILNYASEVWRFAEATHIERVHLQFCNKLLSVKQCMQNDFVYGELGRDSFQKYKMLFLILCWGFTTLS